MAKKDLELSNELRMTMPKQQVDLFDMDNLEEMSFTEFKEKKDMLSALRQQVMLQVDGRKLQQTIKVMDNIDMILDRMMTIDIDENGKPRKATAKELQAYGAAIRDLSAFMKTSTRLDTIDGYGTAAEIHIKIENG